MDIGRVLSKQVITKTLCRETHKRVAASHWLSTVNATVYVTVMVADVSAFVSRLDAFVSYIFTASCMEMCVRIVYYAV